MKILFLITKEDIGGAQKYVQELSVGLDKNKYSVKVLAGGQSGARFLSNAFRPHLLFINDWVALWELTKTIALEKPDIVHLNSSKAGVIGSIAAKLAGVPKVIFTAHGWVFNPNNDLSFIRRKFYILLHKIAARFQDVIINVSEYDRQLAINQNIAPTKKLITVRIGLDVDEIKFLDRKTARQALIKLIGGKLISVASNEIWVGSIGRLVTEKHYQDFIVAAKSVKNIDAKFIIIGSGGEKQKLENIIKKESLQNRFFIIENLSPAALYLKALDIFVLSSIKEGLPYTMLEAMAAGLPVIVTRIGGMTEIIAPNSGQKRGLVMPPREPEELARAINYLIENQEEAATFTTEARKFLKESLSLSGMIKATEEIYDRKSTTD